MKKFRVLWDQLAISELRDIYQYIKRDSPQAALTVREELIRVVRALESMPKKFRIYEYADPVLGEYRSVVRWSYRVIYEINGADVHIVRIVHTSREPGKIIL